MRSILDIVNLNPTDEKVMSKNPEFHNVNETMEAKRADEQKYAGTAFTVFTNKPQLEQAMQKLTATQFLTKEITILTSRDGNFLDHSEPLIESKLGEGCILGIGIGILTGIGWGIFSPYYIATTNSSLIASIFNTLFFAVIFAMVFGVIGALTGRLIPEYKNDRYETILPNGFFLVIIKTRTAKRLSLAKQILNENGGKGIRHPEELRR